MGTPIEALRFLRHASSGRVPVRSPEKVRRASESLLAHRRAPHHEPRQGTPLRVNVYGHFLKTGTGAKFDGIRQLQDPIVNPLSRWLNRAHGPHKGDAWGNPQAYKGTFAEQSGVLWY